MSLWGVPWRSEPLDQVNRAGDVGASYAITLASQTDFAGAKEREGASARPRRQERPQGLPTPPSRAGLSGQVSLGGGTAQPLLHTLSFDGY